MKYFLSAFVLLLTLVVGAAAGNWYAATYNEARGFAFDAAEFEFYSTFWSVQLSEGTDATREEAIRGHLALIEKRQGRTSPMFTEKISAADSALGYARLSALAKKRGADQAAEQLADRAVSFCPKMGWRECNIEKIMSMVQHLDKQGIFGQKSKKTVP